MPSTFTLALRLVKQAVAENNNTWGTIFNQQFADLIDTAIAGYTTVAMSDANKTLTTANGSADESRSMGVKFTGTLTAARNVIVPTVTKLYFIQNATTGGFSITIKTSGGTGITIPNGKSAAVICDGTNVIDAISFLPSTTTIDGFSIGYQGIPQNSQSGDYTLVLSDAGKHIYHPSADTAARAWTIPANASVAFPIGTAITFIVDSGAGPISLFISGGDILTLAGTGATGTRSLSAPASATMVKVAATRWVISGLGVS
jgi:hypothetical protein